MELEFKPKRPWKPWQYIALMVLAVVLAVCLLRPLGQGLLNPFQQITSVLSSQQR